MEVLGRREGIAPTHSRPRHYVGISGQCRGLAALYPGGRTPGTHWIGGWVATRAGLDTGARGNVLPVSGIEP
jgi:hypothetical protein